MSDIYEQEDAMTEEDREFDWMMASALEEPEAAVPAGLEARLHAWTAVEMGAQMRALSGDAARAGAGRGSVTVNASFRDFGVLNTGRSSRRALFVSTGLNLAAAALVVLVTGVVKKIVVPPANTAILVAPVPPPVAEPLREQPRPALTPRLVPPTPLAQPRVEQPRVEVPPSVVRVVTPEVNVNLAPPSISRVERAPAARAVSLTPATTASAANNVPRAANVDLGKPDGPLKALNGPAVAPVTLNAGSPGGVAGSRSGGQPGAVHLDAGAQPGTASGGRHAGPVSVSVTGGPGSKGNGTTPSPGAVGIQISPTQQRFTPTARSETIASLRKPPVITFLAKPPYSEEAKRLHVEGEVRINVRFLTNGSVEVLGVAQGLGHGLDELALQAARSIQFRPATDGDGKAVDFQTFVTVHFAQN